MKLSIAIPVYNERFWLRPFFSRLKKAPLNQCHRIQSIELIVVDDGSTDGTTESLHRYLAEGFQFESNHPVEVKYLPQEENRGKGAAIRKAIENSTGDVLIIQDADLEYSPSDYPALINPITDNTADVVFGSRFVGNQRRVIYFWHFLLNKFLTLLSNILFNLNFTDIETGYKSFKGDVIRNLKLTSNRFGIEPEITARVSRANLKLFEVPISYRGRKFTEGKKIGWKDGVAALFHILKFALIDRTALKPGTFHRLSILDRWAPVLYEPAIDELLISLPRDRSLNILEVGAGIGSITKCLAKLGTVTSTDVDEYFVSQLNDRYQFHESVRGVVWDTTEPPHPGMGDYDLIVAINVLEHLQKDAVAIENWKGLLKPGGKLLLMTPNNPKLFGEMDKVAGHVRRYTPTELGEKFEPHGFRSEKMRYINPLGTLGWYIQGKWFKSGKLSERTVSYYARLKPILRFLEKPLSQHTGLSILALYTFDGEAKSSRNPQESLSTTPFKKTGT